jgi:hypothetical protein
MRKSHGKALKVNMDLDDLDLDWRGIPRQIMSQLKGERNTRQGPLILE